VHARVPLRTSYRQRITWVRRRDVRSARSRFRLARKCFNQRRNSMPRPNWNEHKRGSIRRRYVRFATTYANATRWGEARSRHPCPNHAREASLSLRPIAEL